MPRPVYRFEAIDETLDLVPLAGRRALDRAGRKVGLEAWRRLSPTARAAIVEAGASAVVDAGRVRELLAGVEASPLEGRAEPSATVVPPALSAAGVRLSTERWAALRALDRWALESLAARERTDALRSLLAELEVVA